MKLISATPSPYARKVHIALCEKGIPFELQTEVPWDHDTQTPKYNPLEKLPVLLVPNANNDVTPVYESHFIMDWLETKYPSPFLLPADPDQRLAAKEVEVVCDGVCDALVLRFFESQRDADKQSPEWRARQERKIHGGIRWLNDKVQSSGADGIHRYIVGGSLSHGDIAAGSLLGFLDVRATSVPWKNEHPALKSYFDGLSQRESFKTTEPYAQTFKDKIV